MITEKTDYLTPALTVFKVEVEKFIAASVEAFSEVDIEAEDF